jgi:ABC-2 type transport system ATP-binding protein
MSNNEIAVKTEGLTKRFGKFMAVDHVSLEVNKREIFGFLGANGAGKTTTIRMLCGLLLPTEGRGTVAGFDIREEPEKIKRNIGYMSQKFSLYNDLRIKENLGFFGGIYGLGARMLEQRSREIMERLGLWARREEITRDLPLGYKQRLALGCAVMHEPRILFLDEPTAGVDPIARREFWNLIYQMAEAGTTVFVTTHYMDEAEYCNRLSIMHQGRIIAVAGPQALKQEHGLATVQDVFIHLVKGQQG